MQLEPFNPLDALELLWCLPSSTPPSVVKNFSLSALQAVALSRRQAKGFDVRYFYRYNVTTLNISRPEVTFSTEDNILKNIVAYNSTGGDEPLSTVFVYNHSYSDPCFLRNVSLKYVPACAADSSRASDHIRQVLFTAVQRSGTHYLWEMWNRLGIHVHHEGVGPHGAVSWLYAINAHSGASTTSQKSFAMAVLYAINNPESLRFQRFRYIFHQVRHPLRVITTLVNKCAEFDRIWKWISKLKGLGTRISSSPSPLLRAMWLYLIWNRHIEVYADARFVMETTSVRDVCRWAGFADEICSAQMLESVPKENHNNATSNGSSHTSEGALAALRKRFPKIFNKSRVRPSRRLEENTRAWVSWEELEREGAHLAREIKLMCLEYGMPLDLEELPQEVETMRFHA